MVRSILNIAFAFAAGAALVNTAQAATPIHSADTDFDRTIALAEVLRIIQFYNSGGLHCDAAQEDGYAPGAGGGHTCPPHAADHTPQDWVLSLSEVLRMIQFYNSDGYCRAGGTEDAYKPGDGIPENPGFVRYFAEQRFTGAATAPGYTLPLDFEAVAGQEDFGYLFDLETLGPRIAQDGFAVFPFDFSRFAWDQDDNDDIITPYTLLNEAFLPVFVTSDVVLHLYHVQFGETLKEVEETEFVPDIAALVEALLADAEASYAALTGDLQEAALRNVAYFAVARELIRPDTAPPALVADLVNAEVALIDAHDGFAESPVFIYREDYSQYVPRGHYTRSEGLERYFRTLMWFGRIAFLLKGAEVWGPAGDALVSLEDARIQTLQACLIARAMDRVSVDTRTAHDVWKRIYDVTAFYVGVADDLAPYEYLAVLDRLFGADTPLDVLEDGQNFFDLRAELALLRSPQIYGGTGMVFVNPETEDGLNAMLDKSKGMRFMGQRFVPDSYIMQRLVFPSVLDYTGNREPRPFSWGFTGARYARCYPRGLDVMTLLGSAEAELILEEEGDTEYLEYEDRMAELMETFAGFSTADWNQNLYWGWLYALKALLEPAEGGYPAFAHTQAWRRKQLNAALASWAQLRHDTILYAKPSYGGTETGMPDMPPGYVEPAPEFFTRLLALTRMTRTGLSDLGALSETAETRLTGLENLLQRLISIIELQFAGTPLTEQDQYFLNDFAAYLEQLTLGVEGTGVKTTLIADVHTNPPEALVVEEGTGDVDAILVACPAPDGTPFLAAGATLSYYEFKQPMSGRLTDEAWRALLASPDAPARPAWMEEVLAP